MFLHVALTLVCFLNLQTALCDQTDIGLNPLEMIKNHGYPAESHEITTEDGYILTYYRIPHGIADDGTTKRPAVFLMHGVTGSASDFVATGPARALAYVLVDAGYDVWLGNARGNAFSRKHSTIDPDADPEGFYNFTWHEIGYYDFPAAVDYILELKKDESLYLVAHSQGTTAYLVFASTRPEYHEKIRLASLMAGAAILKNFPNVLVKDLCKYIDKVEVILKNWNIHEIPYLKEIRDFVVTTCADPSSNSLCDIIYNLRYSGDGGQVEEELLPVLFSNNPSNAGLKQFVHFGQLVRDGVFHYYDYGTEQNLQVYGTEVPPEYDLSKITTPVAVYYGKNDGLIAVEDEQTLIEMLPNVVNDYLVPYDLFNHSDFVYAKDVIELLYNELLDVMAKY